MTTEHIGLGIDAGGTYTDAVVYDLDARTVLAKAKALTTYHDLVEGIRGALEALPRSELARVRVTSLSTTLATNSVVEGRGHKVGLIVLAPWTWFVESIGHAPVEHIPGAVDALGDLLRPLDEEACRRAVRRLVDGEHCAALAVGGYGCVRNPIQANRVRAIALEECAVPIVCAHEVSRRLDAVQGARTAVANARLLPVIGDLIRSVRAAMDDHGVAGRLMVVKGDGTPIDERVARVRPVETILSGPAASVSGARVLTGLASGLVMDIGGTTTDCAILEDGHVGVADDGARVGAWSIGVDAADIRTVGLGGDSRLDFTRDRELLVGPRRSIPLAYTALRWPSIARWLAEFREDEWSVVADAGALDVLVKVAPCRLQPTPAEERLLEILEAGPAPALEAASNLGCVSRHFLPLDRLEAAGVVQRASLTPTDLMHVTGEFAAWDAASAARALAIFSRMFGSTPEATLATVRVELTRRVFREALRREISHDQPRLPDLPDDWGYLLDRAFSRNGGGALDVRLGLRRPIIAIGAPARVLVTPVTNHLDAEVVIPDHADVANAVGAIGAEIVVREECVIQAGSASAWVVHTPDERLDFTDLHAATSAALRIAEEHARARAAESGAHEPAVIVTSRDRTGLLPDGDEQFLERRVLAVASGSAFAPPTIL